MKKFLKSCRASTAIEFAIIAPVFFLLLIGICEIGLTLFFDSSINSGIRSIARKGVAQGVDNVSEIQNMLNAHMGGIYNDSKATLAVAYYDKPTDIPTNLMNNPQLLFGFACTGCSNAKSFDFGNKTLQSNKIAIYGVKYSWGGLTKLFEPIIPTNLYSITIVRNEAF